MSHIIRLGINKDGLEIIDLQDSQVHTIETSLTGTSVQIKRIF